MTFTPSGKHLIAGLWQGGAETFQSTPLTGAGIPVHKGSVDLIDQAVRAAEDAFWTYSQTTREDRAVFLETIADEIEARGADITAFAHAESGLPEGRLNGERGRTTGQLRLFAAHIRDGAYLDVRHDAALPDRAPMPRPDLWLVQRPIGPVAVFGASNFPLAFSVAGGDTASALAAGCPVVVKGHEAHPRTGEIVAVAIAAAVEKCGLPAGVFGFVQGGDVAVSRALVTHPLITAVGFTGSLAAGRALFDLCGQRPTPIPFFGELGSINPMFLLPAAMTARSEAVGKGWANSLLMGAGQFCTNPGLAIVLKEQADTIVSAACAVFAEAPAQPMLTDGIAAAYRAGMTRIAGQSGVTAAFLSENEGRTARPALFTVSAQDFHAAPILAEEVFGPLGILVTVDTPDQMVALARDLEGQLTTTLHMDAEDTALAARLMPILERKAGRVMANGFPTGVEVCDSMIHGGPYPAATGFGSTSVGTMAIRRFLRPVCYQDIPVSLRPTETQQG